MNLESDLARDLDRAIPHLPAAPAAAYLSTGRRARRRRRAYVGVAAASVVALTGGVAMAAAGGMSPTPATPLASQATSSPGSDQIPDWVGEDHGDHGPVAIHPNGDLWVSPDARLIRRVELPPGSFPDDVVSAYAVEVETDAAHLIERGKVWWSFVFRTSPSPEDWSGEMVPAGYEWTTDFDLWVDDITAEMQGRPRFGERLVRFADDDSERLVARPGAKIVDQVEDVVSPDSGPRQRNTVAEVTYAGKTWFVLARELPSGRPIYSPYQAKAVSASDIDAFLDHLRDRVDE